MKIVSVMTGAAPGGAEFAAVELLEGLISRGHEAVMLSDWPGIARDTRVEARTLELGPKLSGRSWPTLALRWPFLRRRLRRALEAEWPYDVLLFSYKKEQLLAAGLPEYLRPRIAWAEWGPVPRQMRRGLGRRMYVSASRGVRPVMAISAGTGRSLVQIGVDPATVAVVPNAIRTDEVRFSAEGRARVRAALDIPPDAFVVGCTSRFHHKKRNDVAIDAVAKLDSDTHLILAGDGETESKLRARAELLGERAHFIPTPGPDVADVLSAFDVAVFCPSPAEGTPTSVVLGMLVERPYVSTGSEGVVDLIGDGYGAIASPENDPAAVTKLLRGYRDDVERRRREGIVGGERARERFNSATVAAAAERLIAAGGPGR
ncbi:MAG TPA: glycosyltransferase family 4 protein [Solirubrobacterales bacterium]|nr:glycosyltransferase family 4 protein [Solirubrobacterales bacterium]